MPGVRFDSPPEEMMSSIMGSIDRVLATLPPEANGAIVGVATTRGANAAIVARSERGWTVAAWVGKSWGGPVAGGARIVKTW